MKSKDLYAFFKASRRPSYDQIKELALRGRAVAPAPTKCLPKAPQKQMPVIKLPKK